MTRADSAPVYPGELIRYFEKTRATAEEALACKDSDQWEAENLHGIVEECNEILLHLYLLTEQTP